MAKQARGSLRIGTSGWMYDSWRGPFYSQDAPKRLWLNAYAERFSTVEINSAFYRTPSLEAVQGWREATPPGFCFSWKASKFITHWKRLGESSDNSLALMQTRLKVLSPKTAVVLFQLPPQFAKNMERLNVFLGMLPKQRRYAFEFRHASWYDDAVLDLLHRYRVSLCISDHADAPSPWLATADHVYVRGHGPRGDYGGRYSTGSLRRWAKLIADWQQQNRSVFVYFDNDQKAAAPGDALRLAQMLASNRSS
jgi:uncharacterized protein YecE (DUF72 family)